MRFSRDRSEDRFHVACPGSPFVVQTHEGAAAPAEPLAAEAELQARYREEYLVQLRHQACPGCGEDLSLFGI